MKRQRNPEYADEQFKDCRLLQPDEMTPQQRLQEIARILAHGVLLLRKCQFPVVICNSAAKPEISTTGLDVPPETVLTGDKEFGVMPNKPVEKGS
jgi:hypothetical protein